MSSLLEWAAVAAGSGGLGALITKGFDWRLRTKEVEASTPRLDAEAARIIADTAVSLVAPLQHQLTELQTRVSQLEDQHALALGHIRVLYSWIYSHFPDSTPPAPPKELEINY